MMEFDIACHNATIFKNIKQYEKMIVDKDSDQIYLDDRYGQSVRRWYNDDSREDLLVPIERTFDKLINEYKNGNYSYNDLKITIENLVITSIFTYQDFDKLHKGLLDIYGKIEVTRRDLDEQRNHNMLIDTDYFEDLYDEHSYDVISDIFVSVIGNWCGSFWNVGCNFCTIVTTNIKDFYEDIVMMLKP